MAMIGVGNANTEKEVRSAHPAGQVVLIAPTTAKDLFQLTFGRGIVPSYRTYEREKAWS